MAVWYEVERTERGIADFMECNRKFRDFRIERITFVAEDDTCEIYLKHATCAGGLVLRFSELCDMFIRVDGDYLESWLAGATLLVRKNGVIRWIAAGNVAEDALQDCAFATWVESHRLTWAITDAEEQPAEIQAQQLHGYWNTGSKNRNSDAPFTMA